MRRWTLSGQDGSLLTEAITASSATGKAARVKLEKPIPAAIASSVHSVHFRPAPSRIIRVDPLVEWDLAPPAHGTIDVGYQATVSPTGATRAPWRSERGSPTPSWQLLRSWEHLFSSRYAVLRITDLSQGWNACWTNGPGDLVTCNIFSWTDSEISFGGFAGDYGPGGWVVSNGDDIEVQAWNPQSGNGPATCQVVVGSGSPANCRCR